MPAPTALLKQPADEVVAAEAQMLEMEEDNGEFSLEGAEQLPADTNVLELVPKPTEAEMDIDEEEKPRFGPVQNTDQAIHIQTRKVPIPPHRMTP
jgi:RNA-binding protein PNO1